MLVDASGGRGITPAAWEAPATAKRVGFAGGLSPENMGWQLPLIRSVAKPDFWVDMESSLRDPADQFSVTRAQAAIAAYDAALNQ